MTSGGVPPPYSLDLSGAVLRNGLAEAWQRLVAGSNSLEKSLECLSELTRA